MFITKLANFLELGLLASQTSGLTIVWVLLYITQNVIKTLQLFMAERMNTVNGHLLTNNVAVTVRICKIQ